MRSSLPAFLLMPLLLAGPALAQPLVPSCQAGVRHLEVSKSSGDEPPVCISPGQATVFSFDVKLAPGSVTLEGADGFTSVEPGPSTLKLVPSEKVPLGKPLWLTVRFADSAAPTSAAFVLVGHAAQAEPLVDVHRPTRTAESFRQEVSAKEEEVRQLREENARLRAATEVPGGLRSLWASGVMSEEGVAAKDLSFNVTRPPTNPLLAGEVMGYRSKGRVAVALWLTNSVGAATWTTEGATLSLEGQRVVRLKVLPVWQEAPIAPGEVGLVVVEAETASKEARDTYTLKLWEVGGTRSITVGGVMFP